MSHHDNSSSNLTPPSASGGKGDAGVRKRDRDDDPEGTPYSVAPQSQAAEGPPCAKTYKRDSFFDEIKCNCGHRFDAHTEAHTEKRATKSPKKKRSDLTAPTTLQEFVSNAEAAKAFRMFPFAGKVLTSTGYNDEMPRQRELCGYLGGNHAAVDWPALEEGALNEDLLHILGGESGCGKTLLMNYLSHHFSERRMTEHPKATTLKMYERAKEVFSEHDYPTVRAVKPTEEQKIKEWVTADKLWCDGRNTETVRLLTQYLREKLGLGEGSKFTDRDDGTHSAVYLVLDEMGPFREYLRALCVNDVRESISAALGVDVYIITGGTGCSVPTPGELGSASRGFTAFAIPEWTLAQWKSVFPEIVQRIESDRTQVGNYARGLLGNARSAVCLMQVLTGREGIDLMTVVVKAAGHYRRLNGLQDLDDESIFKLISHALFLVMFKHDDDLSTENKFTVKFKHETGKYSFCQKDLSLRFGMITDSKAISADGSVKEAAPEGAARYRITEAQSVMFLVQYGLRSAQTPTGEGFELSVKDYLVLALTAAYFGMGSRVEETTTVGGLDHASLLQLVFPHSNKLAARPLGSLRGITVVDSDCQLHAAVSETTEAAVAKENTLTRISKEVIRKRIVIVVNAPQAANADLMVFFPGGVWWSIQVKRYTTTKLNSLAAWEELSKMGYDGGLASATTQGEANATASAAPARSLLASMAGKACLATLMPREHRKPMNRPEYFTALQEDKITHLQDDKNKEEVDVVVEAAASLHNARVAFARRVQRIVFPSFKPSRVIQVPCFVLGHNGAEDRDNNQKRFDVPDGVPAKYVKLDATYSSLYPIRAGYSTAGLNTTDYDFLSPEF